MWAAVRAASSRVVARPPAREALILLAFVVLTALMTWPWVTRMRDAVADPGDPYLLAWALWWDYHQTFNDPLHLFDANIFYPLSHTLAFSESCYGVALLFFPLFALGLRPLTVHSVATFVGFAFCGYGAFRLTRTLTGSTGAAWVAGLFFAFMPYRFHLLSHLHYLFTGWLPLTLEALVLFARAPTRRRAAWLAAAFVMNALTCLTWFIVALAPLTLTALYLAARYGLWRDRAFLVRGAAAAGVAVLALAPFLYPYYHVSKTHNFTWNLELVAKNSAAVADWLVADYRNRLWKGFGDHIPNGGYKLFPGLLPILLAFASTLFVGPLKRETAARDSRTVAEAVEWPEARAARWTARLDALAVAACALALVAAGWAGSPESIFSGALSFVTGDRLLLVVWLSVLSRLVIAYPDWLRRATGRPNLLASIRRSQRGDAFWVGAIWAATGFLMSLGANSALYRILYDLVYPFRGVRVPARSAMVAYVGLAVLAGLGARRVAGWVTDRRPGVRAGAVVACLTVLLLFELRAAPLRFMRGAVFPEEVTLRLKQTPMRGGLVELPTGGGELPHLYMLRAADHGRPLINAISTFVPPHAGQINDLSHADPIPQRLLDLLEDVPASYLVIHNRLLAPERRPAYETFLARGLAAGRLRFVNRFGDGDDLYAVVKTEPEAATEAPLPFDVKLKGWVEMLKSDPVHLLGQYQDWSLRLYRLHVASSGRMPRMDEYMPDALALARGAVIGVEDQERVLEKNAGALAEELVARPAFAELFGDPSNEQYVDRLLANAGIEAPTAEHEALVAGLNDGTQTRASVLRRVADNEQFARRERVRGLVLLHYFGYLRRNPGDPPDVDVKGLDFWIREVEASGDPSRLARGFMSSYEYEGLRK